MTKNIKQLLSLTLLICVLTTIFSTTPAYGNEIMPRYNNVSSASVNTVVNSNGTLTISYNYLGFSSTTSKAVITTYIEKQFLGIFWLRVDLGTTDDEWVQTVNSYKYTGTRTFSLPSTGTYRTTVIYKVYGTDGSSDEITCQDTITY